MQFLLHPSQEEWPLSALAEASWMSTGWRKWNLVLKPGFDSTPIFGFIYFWLIHESQALWTGETDSFLSPCSPTAHRPTCCLFSLLNISLVLPFLPRPWYLPDVFVLECCNSLLLVSWSGLGNLFLIPVSRIGGTRSPDRFHRPYLPSTPSDHLLNCQHLPQFHSLHPQTHHRARHCLPSVNVFVWVPGRINAEFIVSLYDTHSLSCRVPTIRSACTPLLWNWIAKSKQFFCCYFVLMMNVWWQLKNESNQFF